MSSKEKKENGSGNGSIRDLVHDASVVIAHYWPMRSFVHHNPIRHLEIYPFEEAVRVARRFRWWSRVSPQRYVSQAGRFRSHRGQTSQQRR